MAQKKQRDAKKTREAILKAAVNEIIEHGYHGARMQAIADNAKVNKAMIHYYYKNKETMYKEALNDVMDVLIVNLGKISDEPVPVEKKIEQILDVYIVVFDKYHDYTRLMIYEAMRGGKLLVPILTKRIKEIPFNPVTGKIYKYFKDRIKRGEIKKVNIFQLIITIISQIIPVYLAKNVFRDLAGHMGIEKRLFNQLVKERKKFIVDVIMNGIKK